MQDMFLITGDGRAPGTLIRRLYDTHLYELLRQPIPESRKRLPGAAGYMIDGSNGNGS